MISRFWHVLDGWKHARTWIGRSATLSWLDAYARANKPCREAAEAMENEEKSFKGIFASR
jgi:alpha-amylase/alpha-mannosidase (GH57 family)